MDLISIILPVYNAELSIKTTIKSILKQTHTNFELIIINDGSTDNSHQLIQEYQKTEKRIKYFSIPNNGVSNARNYGLKHATGTYVTFIDSDDTYEENYLQILLKSIKKYNADLASCAYKTVHKNPKIVSISADLINYSLKEYIEILQPNLLINQLWNKIYKLNIIKKNTIFFDTDIDLAEDYKFNLEYFSQIKSQVYINIPLYNYRINDNGLGFKYRKDSSKIKLQLLEMLENLYNKKKYSLNYIYKNYIIQYFAWLSNIVDKRSSLSQKEKLEQLAKIMNDESYYLKIEEIKRNSNRKTRVICKILLIKNKYFLYFLGVLANNYDKLKKRTKI